MLFVIFLSVSCNFAGMVKPQPKLHPRQKLRNVESLCVCNRYVKTLGERTFCRKILRVDTPSSERHQEFTEFTIVVERSVAVPSKADRKTVYIEKKHLESNLILVAKSTTKTYHLQPRMIFWNSFNRVVNTSSCMTDHSRLFG